MRRVRRTRSSSERSWVTSSTVPSNVSSAASSCSIAGRSRWFVGSSSTSRLAPLCHQQGERRPRPLARRQRRRRPGDVVGDEAELGQQRAHVAGVRAGGVLERPQQRRRPVEPVARLLDLADDHARTDRPPPGDELDAAEQGVDQRRLARAVGADECDPLAGADERGRSVRAGTSRARTTAPSSRATTSPLRPGDCTCNRSCHGSRGLSTASSRSIARSVRAARPASCSVWLILKARMFLSGSSALRTFDRPCDAHSRSRCARPSERAALRVVVLEPLPRRPPGDLPLVEVGLPAAAVVGGAVGELVELDDVGDGPGEERAVVAHQHDRRAQVVDPALEAIEAVEVEVVGRLVEQEHVEAGEQQGGQPGPGRLATGQRRRRLLQQPRRQAQLGPDLADARVEVGAAQRRASGRGRPRSGRRCRPRRRPGRRSPPPARRWRSSRRSAWRGTWRRSRRRTATAPAGGSRPSPSAACARRAPRSSGTEPASACSSVDLPTPLGPTRPTRWPGATARSTASRTVRSGRARP